MFQTIGFIYVKRFYTSILGFFCPACDSFSSENVLYVMLCMIWYHLYNLKYVKNTHEGVLKAFNVIKSNATPWVFFMFF